MSELKATPDWLKAVLPQMMPSRVDHEKRIIHGMIVAEEGPFRTKGRGEFDAEAIDKIAGLMAGESFGLKSRFTHPTLSGDGLGTFLGRAKHPSITSVMRDGVMRSAVRADLYLDETSFDGPKGNMGGYVMRLAESDPAALGASLVLKADQELRLDKKGRPLTDANGQDLPPLWRPTELHAVDVVDTGDATRSFLAADIGLPDQVVRNATALLDSQFAGQSRSVIRARLEAWLERYFEFREIPDDRPLYKEHAARLAKIREQLGK